jgi:hypothetical protein
MNGVIAIQDRAYGLETPRTHDTAILEVHEADVVEDSFAAESESKNPNRVAWTDPQRASLAPTPPYVRVAYTASRLL